MFALADRAGETGPNPSVSVSVARPGPNCRLPVRVSSSADPTPEPDISATMQFDLTHEGFRKPVGVKFEIPAAPKDIDNYFKAVCSGFELKPNAMILRELGINA